jgi:3-dehydroquinate synthase
MPSETNDVRAAAADAAPVIHQRIRVGFDYPVVFAHDVFAPESDVLAEVLTAGDTPGDGGGSGGGRVLLVLDGGLCAAWPELPARAEAWFARRAAALRLAAPPVIIPGGEVAKNDPAVVARLHGLLHGARMDRHAFVVIAGGGAVLDAAGFAAATAHRGLRVVRLPSTVLSQADSGVGVKNGVNAFATKNFLGTFVPPFAVIEDARFLDCLPLRDRIAGVAEALKVALIRDPAFFDWLAAEAPALAAGSAPALVPMIRRAAELHLQHIATSGDPFELGSARPLDFGHWAAHKLETMTGHALRHGEAVALGIRIDSAYAAAAGMLAPEAHRRIEEVAAAAGLIRWHEALDRVDARGEPQVFEGIEEFREHLGGRLTVTLIDGIGHGVEVHALDRGLLAQALAHVRRGAERAAP